MDWGKPGAPLGVQGEFRTRHSSRFGIGKKNKSRLEQLV